jgi:hypothetical protein
LERSECADFRKTGFYGITAGAVVLKFYLMHRGGTHGWMNRRRMQKVVTTSEKVVTGFPKVLTSF